MYNTFMHKRSRNKSKDVNILAKTIVGEATKETIEETPQKNPAIVALGRLGGLKGGKAPAVYKTHKCIQ